MEKKSLLLLLMLLPIMASAQKNEKVTSFMDAPFGGTRSEVKKALKKHKLGKPDFVLGEDEWDYSDVTFEGVKYDNIRFLFANERLDAVGISKKVQSYAEIQTLVNAMQRKYTLYEDERSKGSDEVFTYLGGVSHLDNSKYAFWIMIVKGDDGHWLYEVNYGPYGYGK